MPQIRSAASMLLALVGPVALMLLGAVISLALFRGEGASHEDRALPAHSGRAYLGDDGEIIHIAPNVEKSGDPRTLVIHGVGGSELATIHVSREGGFNLEQEGSAPIGFAVSRSGSGSVGMGVKIGKVQLYVEARTDGSGKLLFVRKDAESITNELFIDVGGRVFSNPDQVEDFFRSQTRIDGTGESR
jgi:hypothetical protein